MATAREEMTQELLSRLLHSEPICYIHLELMEQHYVWLIWAVC